MPSPFPGMDPYLEGELWQEFHETLAGAIREQLLKVLPMQYVALLAKRYVLSRPSVELIGPVDEPRVIYPDVHVAQTPPRVAEVAVAYETQTTTPTPPTTQLVSFMREDVPVLSVEVKDVANRRLVTAIEILSPINKTGPGWIEYDRKRQGVLQHSVHLLEIDLLRRGRRIAFDGEPPPAPYYAYLSRYTHRPYTDVWPVALRDRLPVLPVPLLPPDEDVALDLQRAVDACYDLVRYERLLDYTAEPPPPPLSEVDMTWLRGRLAARAAAVATASEG